MTKIDEIKEKVKDKDLYGELRNKIIETRDKYKTQVADIKEKLEKNREEEKVLSKLRDKLQGAIEASDFYAKAVLPTNNPK